MEDCLFSPTRFFLLPLVLVLCIIIVVFILLVAYLEFHSIFKALWPRRHAARGTNAAVDQ